MFRHSATRGVTVNGPFLNRASQVRFLPRAPLNPVTIHLAFSHSFALPVRKRHDYQLIDPIELATIARLTLAAEDLPQKPVHSESLVPAHPGRRCRLRTQQGHCAWHPGEISGKPLAESSAATTGLRSSAWPRESRSTFHLRCTRRLVGIRLHLRAEVDEEVKRVWGGR